MNVYALDSPTSLSYDKQAANVYSWVRSDLEKGGHVIEPMNTLTAPHALSNGMSVMTNSIREFQRIRKLRVMPV